jgi:DUF971 family protein
MDMPSEIGRAGERDIRIRWQDGHESVYPARALRMSCPCAACHDEVTGARFVSEAQVPEDIRPLGIDLVGRYAMSVRWSDGHATGIYTFDRLRRRCPCCQGAN